MQGVVQQATATARREADQVLRIGQHPGAVNFSRLLRQSTYPAFLFDRGQLRGWSAAKGKAFPKVARRAMLAAVRDLGADTARWLAC